MSFCKSVGAMCSHVSRSRSSLASLESSTTYPEAKSSQHLPIPYNGCPHDHCHHTKEQDNEKSTTDMEKESGPILLDTTSTDCIAIFRLLFRTPDRPPTSGEEVPCSSPIRLCWLGLERCSNVSRGADPLSSQKARDCRHYRVSLCVMEARRLTQTVEKRRSQKEKRRAIFAPRHPRPSSDLFRAKPTICHMVRELTSSRSLCTRQN